MASYQSYLEYKASNISWLQAIPKNWHIKRLKFSVHLINNKVNVEESELPYLGLEHIESWTGKKLDGEIFSSEGSASKFAPGDVLFGKLRPYLAKVHLANQEGLISSEALVIRCNCDVFAGFLKYYVLSRDFINIVDSSTYGSKMPRASWDFIGNLPVLLPDLEEQKSITCFLDYKTTQIDALIAKKQALLTKLAEKRTALISHAVTKGLDPSVPMKDSGVEWLGEIPAHWDIKRLKFCLSIQNGRDYKAVQTEDGYPVYGSGGQFTYATQYLHCGEAVLLGRKGTIDKPLYVNEAFWTVDTMYYGVPISGHLGRYLYYCATMIPFRLYSTDTALPSMTQTALNSHQIAIPPLGEQQVIIWHIETITTSLDAQVNKVECVIERLKEYRSALITNTVTGKIDVRDFELPAEATHA